MKAVCIADKFLREDQWYWFELQRVLFTKYFTLSSEESLKRRKCTVGYRVAQN